MSIDGRNVAFGSDKPFTRGGQTLVPLDVVARAANFDYNYDSQRQMIRAGRDRGWRLGLHSRTAYFSGERRSLPVASEIRNGTLYVSVQFIGLASGGSISWDSAVRTVVLTLD